MSWSGEIQFTQPEEGPCPVCGHPTGNCTGPAPAPRHVIGFDSRLSETTEQTVFVPEDIFEDRQFGPFTTRRVRVARAGTYIPIERARELGLL